MHTYFQAVLLIMMLWCVSSPLRAAWQLARQQVSECVPALQATRAGQLCAIGQRDCAIEQVRYNRYAEC